MLFVHSTLGFVSRGTYTGQLHDLHGLHVPLPRIVVSACWAKVFRMDPLLAGGDLVGLCVVAALDFVEPALEVERLEVFVAKPHAEAHLGTYFQGLGPLEFLG